VTVDYKSAVDSWGPRAEVQAPARAADLVADLLVPVGQSVVTAVVLASVLTFAAAHVWQLQDLGPVWLGVFLVVLAAAWLMLLGQHRRLLWRLEVLAGQDVDGDGQVGQPAERLVFVDRRKAKVEAEEARSEGAWLSFVDFVQRLPAKGTSVAAWQGELGRQKYGEFRDILVDYGLAAWNSYRDDGAPNKSQGWSLVVPVPDILEQLSIE